jgi:DNA-directed RNA polymerase specialized sigma24 family protein
VSEISDPDDDAVPLPYWPEVEEIFLRNSRRVNSALLMLLKSPQDAEDVLQEAVVKACRRYHTFQQPGNKDEHRP